MSYAANYYWMIPYWTLLGSEMVLNGSKIWGGNGHNHGPRSNYETKIIHEELYEFGHASWSSGLAPMYEAIEIIPLFLVESNTIDPAVTSC